MVDVKKHPALEQCHQLCLAIERAGASQELTNAAAMAADLLYQIEKLTDTLVSHEKADRDLNIALNTGNGSYVP